MSNQSEFLPSKTDVKRALIVDDDLLTRLLLARFLGKKNWDTVAAYCNEEALCYFEASKFKLAIIDVNLGSGDTAGVELAKKLLELAPDLKIVMTSTDIWNAAVVLNTGLSIFLLKPFDFRKLSSLVTG